MPVITRDERKTIQSRLLGIGGPQLMLIWGTVTLEDASWAANEVPAVVVIKLLGRSTEDATMIIDICKELIELVPNHPANQPLQAIIDRLKKRKAQASADPVQEFWIGSEPMVNRAGLRALLRDIANGFHFGVIYVAGGPMTGRSHSFQLIRHVARNSGVTLHKVDFDLAREGRTLPHLYDGLSKAYEMNGSEAPTHEGATPGDVAEKFASHLRAHLSTAPMQTPKPWLVIDFSDDVPDPAVPEFIRMFCADREANQFDNCVIFVLGPTEHLDSMRGDLLNMQCEDLGTLTETEILQAVTVLNERGTQKLDDAVLRTRVSTLYQDVVGLPEEARFPELRRHLLMLRNEVRAP